MDSSTGMLWGIRLVFIVLTLVVVGLAVVVLLVIVRPVVTEALRARAAGNWWLPFLPRGDGRYGPLAQNHWWSAFRAEHPGSGAGLAVRWGAWSVMSALLLFAMGSMVVNMVRVVAINWSPFR